MTSEFVCGLCSFFNKKNMDKCAVLVTQDPDGPCGALLIHCDVQKSLVHLTFCSCESFQPAISFFCVTRDERIETEQCCYRQMHNVLDECENCIQGQMALSMMRGGAKRWETP